MLIVNKRYWKVTTDNKKDFEIRAYQNMEKKSTVSGEIFL